MSRERGFTLLEVTIAFAIAALALGVLADGIGSGLTGVERAGRTQEAVARAQSHLAALGETIAVAPDDAEGDDGGGYRWHLKVEPLATAPPSAARPDAAMPPVRLFRVIVAISWQEDGRPRSFTLATERLGPVKGAPR